MSFFNYYNSSDQTKKSTQKPYKSYLKCAEDETYVVDFNKKGIAIGSNCIPTAYMNYK